MLVLNVVRKNTEIVKRCVSVHNAEHERIAISCRVYDLAFYSQEKSLNVVLVHKNVGSHVKFICPSDDLVKKLDDVYKTSSETLFKETNNVAIMDLF
jgi:hypothetical protein